MEPQKDIPQMKPDGLPQQPETTLPFPLPEASPVPVTPENAPSFTGIPQSQSLPASATVQPPTNPIAPPAQASPTATSSVLNMPMPPIADDVDLIEREWVDKAKAIVEHTKSDPHEQNKEINKMKADYIQKRYNRQIKIDEA